jgi:hypothetical protein
MSRQSRRIAAPGTTLLVLLACGFGYAGEAAQPAGGKKAFTPPVVQAVYVDAAPVIDGKLDDPCWSQAARLEGFFAPNVDQPSPEETIGLICVDSTAIYVGVICRDRTPEDIKGTETRRNGEIWNDDFVELDLDPWHKHQDAYFFDVTAAGTQFEAIPGGSAAKIEWRGDWKAAATRTPEGWTAEMAIPFSILRYPPGQSTFGFALARGFAKERIWTAYPIMEGRSFNWNQAADLVGLHPPVFKPRPLLMPYVTLDLGQSVGSRFDTGLDVQYRMPNGLTTLATINPDFKQIEDVVEPIAFSYTERYLEERRPFFVTGQSGYLPREQLLYTRRIEDFDAGLKLFGTVGNDTIGLLDAVSYGAENSLAGAWKHLFDQDTSSALLLVNHRKVGEPDNFCYGLDASHTWRNPKGGDTLWTVLYESQTQGAASGGVYSLGGGHWRGAGALGYDWMFRRVSKDFDPELGYYYDQNTIGGSFNLSSWQLYEKGRVDHQFWNVGTDYFPFLDGSGIRLSRIAPEKGWSFRRGYFVSVGLTRAREFNQDSSDVHCYFGWNNRDMYRRGGLSLTRGVRAGGDYRYLSLNQGFRPKKNLSLNLGVEQTALEPPSPDATHEYQAVLTASYDLTPEKSISARFIARDAGVSAFLAYRQVVRRGMDAYVLVGDPDPTRTGFTERVALKLIWVF